VSDSIKVLHVLALDTVGGVECLFAAYLDATQDDQLEHHVLVTRKPVIPRFRDVLERKAASVRLIKYAGGVKVPKWPAFLRRRRALGVARKVLPDVVLLYNCLGNLSRVALAGQTDPPAVNVYYERGAAWARHNKQRAAYFLQQMDGVICNSHAARRMLELGWGCPEGLATVCHNGLRLPGPEQTRIPKRLPGSGPVRIGFAGRLIPFKGPALALHMLAALKGGSRSFELHIAGGGPQLDALKTLAGKLGLLGSVRFHGVVVDMADFYSNIEVFLCPSLREPLGNVCMEAGVYGCPVVATEVDGIPEIVAHGETGYCVPFSLPMAMYQELGGGKGSMPGRVYDPRSDTLKPPRIPSPEQLAQAILQVCESDRAFQDMSQRAHERTRSLFGMETYAAALDRHLLQFAAKVGAALPPA